MILRLIKILPDVESGVFLASLLLLALGVILVNQLAVNWRQMEGRTSSYNVQLAYKVYCDEMCYGVILKHF